LNPGSTIYFGARATASDVTYAAVRVEQRQIIDASHQPSCSGVLWILKRAEINW